MGKFTKDTVITFATNILTLIISIVSSVIIARSLGTEGRGIYTLAILLPSLIISFGNLGIGQSSIFYLGKKEYPKKQIFTNNLLLSVAFTVTGMIIGYLIIFLFGDKIFVNVGQNYLLIGLLLVLPQFFSSFVGYSLLGANKVEEYNYVNIFKSAIFFILLLVVLLAAGLNIKKIIIINIVSSLASTCATIYITRQLIDFKSINFSLNYFKKITGYGAKIYLANLIQFFHYRIDSLLLNIFLNPIVVGLYSIATSIAEKIWIIPQSVGTILFPKISAEKDQKKLKTFTPIICRNILFITAIGLIFLIVLCKPMIKILYSDDFMGAVSPLRILTIGVLAMSGWKILANDLYGRGKAKTNIRINAIAVLLNIILNIILIPIYGINGAAWASSISYTIAFLVMLVVFARTSSNNIKDILFVKKSDLNLYKRLISSQKNNHKKI